MEREEPVHGFTGNRASSNSLGTARRWLFSFYVEAASRGDPFEATRLRQPTRRIQLRRR